MEGRQFDHLERSLYDQEPFVNCQKTLKASPPGTAARIRKDNTSPNSSIIMIQYYSIVAYGINLSKQGSCLE